MQHKVPRINSPRLDGIDLSLPYVGKLPSIPYFYEFRIYAKSSVVMTFGKYEDLTVCHILAVHV